MKKNTIIAVPVAALLAAAIFTPALADSRHHGKSDTSAGAQRGMGMMGQGGGMGMMGQGGGMGMMGQGGGMDMMKMMRMMHGRMGGMGMMRGTFFQSFDADGDGKVTPDETRAGLLGQLETYDSDGNGTLSIEEFEQLHAAAIRARMVDRFQDFDENGDGEVTKDEITAPAKQMERMNMRRARRAGKPEMPMMKDGETTKDN